MKVPLAKTSLISLYISIFTRSLVLNDNLTITGNYSTIVQNSFQISNLLARKISYMNKCIIKRCKNMCYTKHIFSFGNLRSINLKQNYLLVTNVSQKNNVSHFIYLLPGDQEYFGAFPFRGAMLKLQNESLR